MFPLLYEINTRCWLSGLSKAAGHRITLATVPDCELEFLQRCGFTDVWLMGVWKVGTRGRSWSRRCYAGREEEFGCHDIAGSPYAITGYDVAPSLGGEDGLAEFRLALGRRGIRLVLDFIPNHTAIDHPWVREHPEYFITSPTGRAGFIKPYRGAGRWFAHGDCGHGSPWVDTLQLDYRKSAVRKAMSRELIRVSERCDGVRCDMAMLVLADVFGRTWKSQPAGAGEFWQEAIAAVRQRRRDFLFLAEVYWDLEERLQEAGFDFTYDKRLYDRLVAKDGAGAAAYLGSLTPEFVARSAHFLENHDEPRIAGLMGLDEHRAAAVLVAALPGMRLFHEGQLAGSRKHANVHFAARMGELVDDSIQQLYCNLFGALRQSSVGRGEGLLLTPAPAWEGNRSHSNFVLVLWREQPAAFDLAVVNLAPHAAQCFAPIRAAGLEAHEWTAVDLLGVQRHVRAGRDLADRGFYLDLPAHGAQLFHFSRPE